MRKIMCSTEVERVLFCAEHRRCGRTGADAQVVEDVLHVLAYRSDRDDELPCDFGICAPFANEVQYLLFAPCQSGRAQWSPSGREVKFMHMWPEYLKYHAVSLGEFRTAIAV
jgi:hypothetical protein